MVRTENVTVWEAGHSSHPCSPLLLSTCHCSRLDGWISRRFGKCHVSFCLDEYKSCLYLSLKGYIWWAKTAFKHRAVDISQLLFLLNFHISFEGKILYFLQEHKKLRNREVPFRQLYLYVQNVVFVLSFNYLFIHSGAHPSVFSKK